MLQLLLALLCGLVGSSKVVVDVALLADQTGPQLGRGQERWALAQQAAAFFNKHSTNVTMKVISVDTASDVKATLENLGKLAAPPRVALGPGDSLTTLRVASHLAFSIHVPLVGFSAADDELGSMPMYLRTNAPDRSTAEALLLLVQHFQWRQLCVLSSRSKQGREVSDQLAASMPRGLQLTASLQFEPAAKARSAASWDALRASVDAALMGAKATGTRVYALAAGGADAAFLLARAKHHGMVGKGWTWLLPLMDGDLTWMSIKGLHDQKSAIDWSARQPAAAAPPDEAWLTEAAVQDAMDGALGLMPFHSQRVLEEMLGVTHRIRDVHATRLFEAVWLVGAALDASAGAESGRILFDRMLAQRTRPVPWPASARLLTSMSLLPDILMDLVTHERLNLAAHVVNAKSSGAGWVNFTSVATIHMENRTYEPIAGWENGVVWAGGKWDVPSDRTLLNAHKAAFVLAAGLFLLLLDSAAGFAIETSGVKWCPRAAVSIICGMITAVLVLQVPLMHINALGSVLLFNPTFFLLVMLPVIVFESGFTLDQLYFFRNLTSVLSFATLGTLVNAAATGLLLTLVPSSVLGVSLTTAECMCFAALIGAVDPVTTLSIFETVDVPPSLEALIFGESILNDVVSIALFRTAAYFMQHEITAETVGNRLLTMFLWPSFFSFLIGVFCAITCAWTLKKLRHGDIRPTPDVECIILLSFGYLSFAVAEMLGGSGIIATLFCSIFTSLFAVPNMSKRGRRRCESVSGVLGELFETVIFMLIGFNAVFMLAISNDSSLTFVGTLKFAMWTTLFCLFSRAANIFPVAALLNMFRADQNDIPFKFQCAQWHAASRGAISFALAISFPSQHREHIMLCAAFVAIITIFGLGGTTHAWLHYLGLLAGKEASHGGRTSRSLRSMEEMGRSGRVFIAASTRVGRLIDSDYEITDRLAASHDYFVRKSDGRSLRTVAHMRTAAKAVAVASEFNIEPRDTNPGAEAGAGSIVRGENKILV